jgi:hypothetical protein
MRCSLGGEKRETRLLHCRLSQISLTSHLGLLLSRDLFYLLHHSLSKSLEIISRVTLLRLLILMAFMWNILFTLADNLFLRPELENTLDTLSSF